MSEPVHPFELVAKAIECDEDSLSEDSAMYRDYGWDSLGHLKVILAIEQEYGIEVDDTVVESYKTMRGILKCYELVRQRCKSDE